MNELLDEIKKKDRKFTYYAAKSDIYINLEDYTTAKPYLDSALIFEKNNYVLWEQSMIINSYLGNNDDVVTMATECLKYFSDKPNVYLFRANAYYNLNEDKKALDDIDIILKEKSENNLKIQAYNLAAEIYRTNGEDEKSDSCFEAILDLDPENLIVRNNYAYYLALRNSNLRKAEELSKFTIEKEPDNPTYLDTYGWILYMKGDYKQAKNYIEFAIRKGAYNNAEVLEHYGDIMIKLKNCNDALEAYENAFNLVSSEVLQRKIDATKELCK